MDEPVYNANTITAIGECLLTPNGIELMRFLESCYNDQSSVAYTDKGMIDSYQTHVNEGSRHVYTQLKTLKKLYLEKKGML